MKKCLIIVVVLLAMVIVMNSGAMAAVSTPKNVSVTLGPGTLSIAALSGDLTFADLNIGTIHSYPYTWGAATAPSFTLTDATGSGDGWHVIFNCTKLSNTDHSGKYLQVAFNQTQGNITCVQGIPVDGSPTWNGPAKQAVNVVDLNTDTSVVKTSELYGMGQYSYTTTPDNYNINLTPSNTFVGTYSGTFTASIVSGPGGSGSWMATVE